MPSSGRRVRLVRPVPFASLRCSSFALGTARGERARERGSFGTEVFGSAARSWILLSFLSHSNNLGLCLRFYTSCFLLSPFPLFSLLPFLSDAMLEFHRSHLFLFWTRKTSCCKQASREVGKIELYFRTCLVVSCRHVLLATA